jgi:hypothetical protein
MRRSLRGYAIAQQEVAFSRPVAVAIAPKMTKPRRTNPRTFAMASGYDTLLTRRRDPWRGPQSAVRTVAWETRVGARLCLSRNDLPAVQVSSMMAASRSPRCDPVPERARMVGGSLWRSARRRFVRLWFRGGTRAGSSCRLRRGRRYGSAASTVRVVCVAVDGDRLHRTDDGRVLAGAASVTRVHLEGCGRVGVSGATSSSRCAEPCGPAGRVKPAAARPCRRFGR